MYVSLLIMAKRWRKKSKTMKLMQIYMWGLLNVWMVHTWNFETELVPLIKDRAELRAFPFTKELHIIAFSCFLKTLHQIKLAPIKFTIIRPDLVSSAVLNPNMFSFPQLLNVTNSTEFPFLSAFFDAMVQVNNEWEKQHRHETDFMVGTRS